MKITIKKQIAVVYVALSMLAATAALAQAGSAAGEAAVSGVKYETGKHPKAKGVALSFRYPAGWRAGEEEAADLVQSFSGTFEGIPARIMLQVKNAGHDVERECGDLKPAQWEAAFREPDSAMKAINARVGRFSSKPGAIFSLQGVFDGPEKGTYRGQVLAVCARDKIIWLWCGPTDLKASEQQIIARSHALTPACTATFDSLSIADKRR
ncbi:MAG: hypothetical protein JWP36_1859 [Paucimonas sp.]|nr:hypothetical protein [Paucimonas sp.]